MHFKLFMALIILLITLISGALPLRRKYQQLKIDFPAGEAIACGVFLGAGLIHMLGDADRGFMAAGYHYPFAFLIAGLSFLLLLLLEHISTELAHHHGGAGYIALISILMLSIHSFLEGTALGISASIGTTVILAFAIIAHKWAASFSLSLQIAKSELSFLPGLSGFLVFALMTPIGIFLGTWIQGQLHADTLATPIFSALAAGTFLYIGTLHRLQQATMIDRCCNLREFCLMIGGFLLMAALALWT